MFGVKAAKTIEEFKAFSQNMMHESMEITDRLYGQLGSEDIKRTISNLSISNDNAGSEEDLVKEILRYLSDKNLST